MRSLYISILLLALFSAAAAASDDDTECVYTFYVKTGTKLNAGTNSKIQVALEDKNGSFVSILNLKSWGIMKAKHKYFRRGNLDIFAVRGPCIGTPMCRLRLTTDGKGLLSGWYCDYVEVTFTGLHKQCGQSLFKVTKWLTKSKSVAEVNVCTSLEESPQRRMNGRFIVANRYGFAAA